MTNQEELQAIIGKYGYTIERIYKFNKHDRLRVTTPELVMTFSLRKHIKETPLKDLLEVILSKSEFAHEYPLCEEKENP